MPMLLLDATALTDSGAIRSDQPFGMPKMTAPPAPCLAAAVPPVEAPPPLLLPRGIPTRCCDTRTRREERDSDPGPALSDALRAALAALSALETDAGQGHES